MHQTKELISYFSELIVATHGSHTEFDQIAAYQSATPSALIFIQDIKQFAVDKPPAAIVTTEVVAEQIKQLYSGFIICVDDPKLAQALIKQNYDDYQTRDQEWSEIHDSAVIHDSVQLGAQCRVGPNVTIGANCKIADNVIIRANAVIEHDVTIGAGSIINSLANIGYACELGQRVIVQAGCIIGNEGYGFANDDSGRHHRIPHTGNVILHDDVHIGSNSCIDRATYGSTVIHQGVKIDNLCHIAHNVEVGEHSLLTAQCVIAGSSTIGKRVIMSGQTGVLDHKTVPDDSILVHRAGVIESLPHGGMWAGNPAKPFREFVRGLSVDKKVSKLETEIKELKKLLSNK
ncbi:UNVERIFIED_CONTAM: hypothetical protein GTU68_045328 [Idotea baltica]|nr:hypothetical protein [Idotea baltica]